MFNKLQNDACHGIFKLIDVANQLKKKPKGFVEIFLPIFTTSRLFLISLVSLGRAESSPNSHRHCSREQSVLSLGTSRNHPRSYVYPETLPHQFQRYQEFKQLSYLVPLCNLGFKQLIDMCLTRHINARENIRIQRTILAQVFVEWEG